MSQTWVPRSFALLLASSTRHMCLQMDAGKLIVLQYIGVCRVNGKENGNYRDYKELYKAVPPIWYYYISAKMFTIRGGGVDFCLLVGVDLPHRHFQSRSNLVLPDICFRQRVRSYSVNLGSLDFYATRTSTQHPGYLRSSRHIHLRFCLSCYAESGSESGLTYL